MIAASPVIYLLAPAKHNIQTSITIPYEGVKVENYEILIRRSILKQVCELKIDPSESSVAQIDHNLSIAIDEPKDVIHSYLGSDPAWLLRLVMKSACKRLNLPGRTDYQPGRCHQNQRRKAEYIDELMDDEFIAVIMTGLLEWRRLIRRATA